MKRILFLIAFSGLLIISCKKSDSVSAAPGSLDGSWRMILVKDNLSGLTINKPASINGEVEITFTSTSAARGIFSGNTPTNIVSPNDYTTGNNQTIRIAGLSMTKVMETSWGSEFTGNIINAREYSFETGGKLNINAVSKTLVFRKL